MRIEDVERGTGGGREGGKEANGPKMKDAQRGPVIVSDTLAPLMLLLFFVCSDFLWTMGTNFGPFYSLLDHL